MPIFKYDLKTVPADGRNQISLDLPKGAEILTVQVQFHQMRLWARVDPSQPLERRTFEIIGTGDDYSTSDEYRYISTVQFNGGEFVFHVFEVS